MSLLWVAFFVLVALFVAAIVARLLRLVGRSGRAPSRAERPWQ